MKPRAAKLLTIQSPFKDSDIRLRVLEPPGSCHETLRERLYSGTYDKPFVVDNTRRRFLHFDFGAIQSAMVLSDPQRLALAYTRKMMAFLLFNRAPKRILLLGLGGGSLAKFCYGRLPDTSLTAVEVNADVIALRDVFGIPGDNHRFRVINADGAAYVAAPARRFDVILSDACDRRGTVEDLASVRFYRDARKQLSGQGVFVVNLCGDERSMTAHLARLGEAFDGELLSLQVQQDSNMIVFGFKGRRPVLRRQRLDTCAGELERQFRLDFPKYARAIVRRSQTC